MEKQKRWQLYLILAVVLLTVYNILPTIFYYANPLKKPIGQTESTKVAKAIVERVNGLEKFTLSWLKAQTKNLGLKATSIQIDSEDPRLAHVTFKTSKDADFFAKTLYRAGALIPFIPAQLSADSRSFEPDAKTVIVQRRVGVHMDPSALSSYFNFVPKTTEEGMVSPEYQQLINERVAQLAVGFGGVSEPAKLLQSISDSQASKDAVLRLARSIIDFETSFGDQSPITQRYFASFTQATPNENHSELVHKFTAKLETLSQKITQDISSIKASQSKLQEEGNFLSTAEQQRLEVLESQNNTLKSAASVVKRNSSLFEKGLQPLTEEEVLATLGATHIPDEKVQTLNLGARNPFVASLEIDWNKDQIQLILHPNVAAIRSYETSSEAEAIQVEKLNQLLFNEIAAVSREADETITPSVSHFVVSLNKLTNSSSLLTFDIGAIGEAQAETLVSLLQNSWQPKDKELIHDAYPISSYAEHKLKSPQDQKLGLVIYVPAMEETSEKGFRNSSLYVIARGMNTIRQKYQDLPDSPEKTSFEKDFQALQNTLRQNGFIGYSGASADMPAAYQNDYIFELDDYYAYLIAATREDFSVKGSKKLAVLEFTDVEQRILTLNKIDTLTHEDLLKWRDEYKQAQVSVQKQARYDVPAPTKNVLLDNLRLSFIKYFRGDERKILKWGLDLSGGKTVRVGLKDRNDQTITNEDDLKQAVNELYQRVNRLGVSEVGIRTEGSTIVLDFPGSQGLSASDLIQASAMYFNVVNEKFSPLNPTLAEATNTFLEQVWNEAVITSRTDPENLNEIAWQHLGGSPDNPEEFHPLSSHAKLLYDNGLRLAGPKAPLRSGAFDDTLSSISLFRGSDLSDWQGQTNPLVIIFRNYALEGSSLVDVQTGYDASEGNVLSFGVRSSYLDREGDKISPRDDFFAWTSQFSEEKIKDTPKEAFSQGRGWRMAVILNGTIVNAPTLNSPLRDSARITGNFSQREINQLAADLKAGSLSFTPQILSEENVSPDLGKEQRIQGISAALLGLVLVIALMCIYYRFSGVVASVAVLFNLLILWGVLQNLGAALTLPGIAGIILAIGMAVDANVLVFERIREEFALSGRLPSAIQAGYRKAFTAIVDSNLTTIIAAVILLNFDSGPIKGFALTLIIGIISSMFTSLFMTRFFFAGWVQNPKHKSLKMLRLFGETKFNFLSKAKLAMTISIVVMVIGGFFLVKQKDNIFGMDFTGGYALTIDLTEKPNTQYRNVAEQALVNAGAANSDFQIQELNKPNQLRIQLGTSMELEEKPFYAIEKTPPVQNPLFTYQDYPRIVWIVDALEQAGLDVNPATLPELNQHWTEMSGQLSDTMRNQALLGLGLALLSILIYITFRFEFKYAISATIGLAHDILITLGILALAHIFIEDIQIDLQVIAALMTIVGYSLNDTIIIFDRIREDLRVHRKLSFSEIVNHALNATLSRTVMTSTTTLVVLLALVAFGGASIFNFALIMSLGVAIGTLSSLYIAAPMLLYFHRREETKEQESTPPKNA
ncbi:MAG: Protein translocase subunit SecD [Chlamydiales bacterium]|nr:Protein translocase subunit SecD [Chlamydiales bacterium]